MPLVNEERLTARINKWSGGSVIAIAVAGLLAGIAIGILFF